MYKVKGCHIHGFLKLMRGGYRRCGLTIFFEDLMLADSFVIRSDVARLFLKRLISQEYYYANIVDMSLSLLQAFTLRNSLFSPINTCWVIFRRRNVADMLQKRLTSLAVIHGAQPNSSDTPLNRRSTWNHHSSLSLVITLTLVSFVVLNTAAQYIWHPVESSS